MWYHVLPFKPIFSNLSEISFLAILKQPLADWSITNYHLSCLFLMLEHQKKRYACGQCLPAPKESCVASFYQHQRRVVWPVFTSTKGEVCGQFLPAPKEVCGQFLQVYRERCMARWNNWRRWHPSSMWVGWQCEGKEEESLLHTKVFFLNTCTTMKQVNQFVHCMQLIETWYN